MRRIQFYSLKLGRHHNQKEEALCFMSKWAVVYQLRNNPLSLLPQVARHSNGLSITTASASPRLLVGCLLFFSPSPDHTVHTTNSDQRAASKPEQETTPKGALSFYLSFLVFFLFPLPTALRRRAGC